MWILDRKDLREAIVGMCGAFVILSLAVYFKRWIESHIGETLTNWLLIGVVVICVLNAGAVFNGWLFVRDGERREREMKAEDARQRAKWEREEQEEKAEWDAFTNMQFRTGKRRCVEWSEVGFVIDWPRSRT